MTRQQKQILSQALDGAAISDVLEILAQAARAESSRLLTTAVAQNAGIGLVEHDASSRVYRELVAAGMRAAAQAHILDVAREQALHKENAYSAWKGSDIVPPVGEQLSFDLAPIADLAAA